MSDNATPGVGNHGKPPGWYADPWEPADQRWWNGFEWSDRTRTDPPIQLPDEGWYDDPDDGTIERWWDGQDWSDATRPASESDRAVTERQARRQSDPKAGPALATPPPPPPQPRAILGQAPARRFDEAVKVCFKKYATFSGRASRSEYWFLVVFNVIVVFVGAFLDGLLLTDGGVSGFVLLVVLLPTIAAAARRLHDTGRSGWWQLIALVPPFPIVLMVLLALKPEWRVNQYG